jgi:CHAP domain-containing protein
MTHDDFVSKYKGRYIDYDGAYGYQCVDLMRLYQKEVFEVPPNSIPAAGYARDIYKNFKPNQYFDKINNTPTGIPQKGDIIFFNTYPFVYGIAGHVAIYHEGNVNTLISFDQNYPTNTACHLQKHSYRGCLGWLRRK